MCQDLGTARLLVGQIAEAETAGLLRTSVLSVLFLMVYPMMINIDLREVFNVRKHAAAVGLARVFFGGSVEYAGTASTLSR